MAEPVPRAARPEPRPPGTNDRSRYQAGSAMPEASIRQGSQQMLKSSMLISLDKDGNLQLDLDRALGLVFQGTEAAMDSLRDALVGLGNGNVQGLINLIDDVLGLADFADGVVKWKESHSLYIEALLGEDLHGDWPN